MKLFLARHGESEANVLRVISNRDVPHPLTEKGRGQALELANALSGAAIRHVYTSPILRARQTAEIVCERLGVNWKIADGLREFDCGVLEGRGDEDAWTTHLWVQRQWDAGDLDARIEGGESHREVEARFRETLREAERGSDETGDPVLFVTHGALLYSMLPLILSNLTNERILEFGLKNATVIEAVMTGVQGIGVRWNSELL